MKTYWTLLLFFMTSLPAWAQAPTPVATSCAPAVIESDCNLHKVCVPEPSTKKTTKVVYDVKCVDYCLPKCCLFSLFSHSDCGCQNCSKKVYTKKILVKHLEVTEEPTVKCVPRTVDACGNPVEIAPTAPPAPEGTGGVKPEPIPEPRPQGPGVKPEPVPAPRPAEKPE